MFSDHWYRVAQLKPMLQDHVSIERHTYRDEDWWVLVDPLTSRQHRLNHSARYTISLMDGERNLETIWDAAVAALRHEAPTQHEIIELLGQLHAADLLRTDATSDVEELFGRATTRKQRTRKQGMLNPLYLRVPLLDPDRFLNWLSPHFRFLFTNSAYVVAFGLVVLAAILLGTNFESVARSLDDAFLAPKNLALLGAVFVFMKFVHELSHGLAVKRWGGEVHDMGIVLLVLMPIPYVDASAANGFADKRKRMITSAAGIVAELVVASMAMLVWLAVEPGIVKQLAFDAMVVGTVSSLLFNGNPLLRFDGYYVLADAIEIPNLYTRAQRFLQFLLKRALLGSGNEPSPVATRSEALWLASFGVAAFCYRMFVLFVIAIYLSEVFLAVGVLLVVWALATQVVWPFAKGMNSLLASSKGIRQRIRVYGLSVIGVGTCYVALFVIPMPATTAAEGVVWLTDHGVVRAGSDCFVDRVLEISGSSVSRHTPLIECSDDNLNKERDVLRSKIRALQSEYRAYGLREQVKRKLLSEEIASLNSELRRARERIDDLIIVSEVAGTFVIATSDYLPGRFFHKGDIVGFVVNESGLTVRTAVEQEDIDQVHASERVVVRFEGDRQNEHLAFVAHETPAAVNRLPSAALGSRGGGKLDVDPADPEARLLMSGAFLLDLELNNASIPELIGLRAHVLFTHGTSALGQRWSRSLRLLLLRRLDV